jgi:SAM-dependent methyltransferase
MERARSRGGEVSTATEVAGVWRAYWRAHAAEIGGEPPRYLAQALVRALAPAPGQLILEAGSGTGGLSRVLAAQGAQVHLLDIIADCVRRGRGERTCGVVGDLFHLPFADARFDAVFNSGVMEHFLPPDFARGIAEMARVLKPGGRLCVIVPSARGRFYLAGKRRLEAEGQWEYGNEYPQGSLAEYARAGGLTRQEERLIGVRWQARFLQGWRRRAASLLLAPFGEQSRLGASLFGGYLLISTWRKERV